jgi:hypothetical protein
MRHTQEATTALSICSVRLVLYRIMTRVTQVLGPLVERVLGRDGSRRAFASGQRQLNDARLCCSSEPRRRWYYLTARLFVALHRTNPAVLYLVSCEQIGDVEVWQTVFINESICRQSDVASDASPWATLRRCTHAPTGPKTRTAREDGRGNRNASECHAALFLLHPHCVVEWTAVTWSH